MKYYDFIIEHQGFSATLAELAAFDSFLVDADPDTGEISLTDQIDIFYPAVPDWATPGLIYTRMKKPLADTLKAQEWTNLKILGEGYNSSQVYKSIELSPENRLIYEQYSPSWPDYKTDEDDNIIYQEIDGQEVPVPHNRAGQLRKIGVFA